MANIIQKSFNRILRLLRYTCAYNLSCCSYSIKSCLQVFNEHIYVYYVYVTGDVSLAYKKYYWTRNVLVDRFGSQFRMSNEDGGGMVER